MEVIITIRYKVEDVSASDSVLTLLENSLPYIVDNLEINVKESA